jgi:hypothetical protein
MKTEAEIVAKYDELEARLSKVGAIRRYIIHQQTLMLKNGEPTGKCILSKRYQNLNHLLYDRYDPDRDILVAKMEALHWVYSNRSEL